MHRTWKYRLYPTAAQAHELERQLALACDLYNAALEQRIWAWRRHRTAITFREQSKQLTAARHELTWMVGMNALAQHGVLRRLDRAFQAFYRRVRDGQTPGFPRFKSRRAFRSLIWPQYGNGARIVNAGPRNGRVALQGAGQVKFRAHRPLPETAKLGQITVLHACSGRWWLTIACELPEPDGRQPDGPFEPVGIDVGIHSFVALSTGERIPGVHAERHARRELRQAHRRVSRRQRGSRSRQRAVRRLARVQEKVAGARRTHHHTVARRLVRQHSVLAVEDLRVSRMTRSARGSVEYPGTGVRRKAGLNRAILDQGWAVFVRCLEAKLEEAGGILVRVDPYGTSQQCPSCGRPAPKPFHQRLHRCQGCGLVEDRDVAAAQVVANRAAHILKRLGREPGGGRARGRTDEAESCRPVDDSQDTGIVTGGPLSSIPPSLRHGAAQQSEQSFALAISDAKGIAAQLSDQPPEWRQPRSCGRTTCAADG